MDKHKTTREKLQEAAAAAFWTKGYSNTSLREIASKAGVDVALISRYFGGKLGLFEATLEGAFHWPDLLAAADAKEVLIRKYVSPDTGEVQMAITRMFILNAADPDVGDLVRKALHERLLDPLQERLGGPVPPQNLALFIAAILGLSVVKQSMQLAGTTQVPDDVYEAQMRHMIEAALSFDGSA